MEDLKDKLVPISTSGGPTHVIAPLMPSQDTTPDQIAFFNRPNSVPYVRHSPLPVAASAQTNAVAKTIAREVVASTPAVPAAPTQVDLTMPAQYTVTESMVGNTEDIAVQWLPVPAGWALLGPGPVSALQSIGQSSGAGAAVVVSATPQSAPAWGLFVEFSNNNLVAPPSGWTLISSSSSQNIFYETTSGAALVVNSALSAATNFVSAILVFGGAPTIVQTAAGVLTGASGTISLGAPVTAGNTLLAFIQAYNGAAILTFSISSSLGNIYFPVSTQAVAATSDPSVSQTTFIDPVCVGGSETITWTISGVRSAPNHQEYLLMEIAPLPVGLGLPFFQPITPFNLPNSPQVATGSRSSGAALTSLLAGLATIGIIIDNTTP